MKTTILTLAISSLVTFNAASALTTFSVNADSIGFTGWTENNSTGDGGQAGRFLGASGTGMDTNSVSWGQYANSAQTSSSTFNFGGVLGVGNSVEISVSIGYIDNGGTVGFGLQNGSSVNRFETYYIGGSTDAWKINDAGGQEDITGVTTTYTSAAWHESNYLTFLFTQGASDTYSVSVNGTPITNSGLTLAASDIEQIRIFNFNAGSGSDFNQYFNTLTVVPEPSTYAGLLGIGVLTLAAVRRRR